MALWISTRLHIKTVQVSHCKPVYVFETIIGLAELKVRKAHLLSSYLQNNQQEGEYFLIITTDLLKSSGI